MVLIVIYPVPSHSKRDSVSFRPASWRGAHDGGRVDVSSFDGTRWHLKTDRCEPAHELIRISVVRELVTFDVNLISTGYGTHIW